jgi:ubiquinone/menaquinone biosynthesis C-methylase UbiE
VLAGLEREGKDLAALQPADLYPFDQDHYGHLDAVRTIAARLELAPGHQVLDVCAGLGGPARFLAASFGVKVQGLDLNAGRVAGAEKLTHLVGLDARCRFAEGDATNMPFAGQSFDAALSQEAFLHIADKPALFTELRRVLRPGGRLCFTDWLAGPGLSPADRQRLQSGIMAQAIHEPEEYRDLIAAAGFQAIIHEDLSAWWHDLLIQRLEMFRGMEAGTVASFGQQRHETYITAYEFFVGRITEGRLGGGRFTATA